MRLIHLARNVFVALSIVLVGTVYAGSLDGAKTLIANLIPGCRFRVTIPKAATLVTGPINRDSGGFIVENPRDLKTRLYIEPFRLGFECVDATDGNVNRGWATFDNTLGRWQANLDPDEVPKRNKSARLYQLQNVNSTGWAITIDDVIGEEFARGRVLHYCLVRPPKALCGHGDMAQLIDHSRKADLTPYGLKILRSIEFLDTPVTASQTDPASAASSSSR